MTIEDYCQLYPNLVKTTLTVEDLDKVIKYYKKVKNAYESLSRA